MADKRKLNAEIDRTLKKVTEGTDAFEDIWKKFHQTNNANQKEKFENDLKKEIKKLQRLRDQIKTWQVSTDIKDKQILIESRKMIESQMERFKYIERETKTKAYSKEGLISIGKVDPKEKEKEEITNWITNSIVNLNQQIDRLESEVETVSMARKKKVDKDEQSKVDGSRTSINRHRFHIDRLEAILRLVDNGFIEFDQIQGLRDDVETYVDQNQEPGYHENLNLYDDFELDDISTLKNDLGLCEEENGVSESSPDQSTSPSPPVTLIFNKAKVDEEKRRSKDDSGLLTQLKSTSSIGKTNINGIILPLPLPPASGNPLKTVQTPTKTTVQSVPATPTNLISRVGSSALGYAQVASSTAASIHSKQLLASTVQLSNGMRLLTSTPLPLISNSSKYTVSSILSSNVLTSQSLNNGELDSILTSSSGSTQLYNSSGDVLLPATTTTTSSITTTTSRPSTTPLLLSNNITEQQQVNIDKLNNQHPNLQQQFLHSSLQHLLSNSQDQLKLSDVTLQHNNNFVHPNGLSQYNISQDYMLNKLRSEDRMNLDSLSHLSIESMMQLQQDLSSQSNEKFSQRQQLIQSHFQTQPSSTFMQVTMSATISMNLDPIYGVSPLGPQPLSRELLMQQQMLEPSSEHMPLGMDSEKIRLYLSSNPIATPPFYPVSLPPVMQQPDFFNRLDADTLFFIFYYMEGTRAQFLAAKALKQKSWRFHTKYLLWFQRHDEPKTITEEYEQGTYIYFNYEKWCQCRKEVFKFEYRYLEDQEL